MSEENHTIEEIVEVEDVEVLEEKKSKWPLIAGIVAAGTGVVLGAKWLFGKLKNSNLNYVELDDEDDCIEEDSIEIEISKE